MSKNKKKSLKKVHAKINNTPVKAEAAKKEESKTAKQNNKNVDKAAKAAANKAAKAERQAKKYAASKARIEARRARKKSIMDKLIDSKETTSSEPIKLTLEQRKERQENRRKVAYNRHIASIKRRCSRMKLTDEQTLAIVNKAKSQWDAAKSYDVVIVYESNDKIKKEMEDLVKNTGIKSACITGSTAFLKDVPKNAVDKLHEIILSGTIYQYSTKKEDLFSAYNRKHSTNKPSNNKHPHSRPCSKSRNINFYNLRRLKKVEKKAKEEAKTVKPVNKKPTQVKEIKAKSTKKAA